MTILSLQNIHHAYFTETQAKMALEDISLSVNKGEFISILGPSGCGKSTLLSIIAGLLTPVHGSLHLDGEPLIAGHKQDIGYMLQQDYLFPWKTIKENILLGLKLQKQPHPDLEIRTLKLLNEIGLPNTENLFPNQLSGGMRQRVALVRTLATNPKVLLLDEPFSALDYVTKLKLENLVFSILKAFHKTVLLVTHDIGEAIAMSDRIYLFSANPGKVFRTFEVPEELRNISPFEARNHPKFSPLFQTIWKEFEALEEPPVKH